jgi:acetyl esterase/lipase
MDPCLDDCVMFAKKLRKLGVDVSLDVIDGLPHGFLNFSQVDCYFVLLVKKFLNIIVHIEMW